MPKLPFWRNGADTLKRQANVANYKRRSRVRVRLMMLMSQKVSGRLRGLEAVVESQCPETEALQDGMQGAPVLQPTTLPTPGRGWRSTA